jgi:putative hydrolase of the HAD superfamily
MQGIKAILFDFGGVLADEGFREGMRSIGRKNGLNPDEFFLTATELIHESGYVTGLLDEHGYWNILREGTGIAGSDEELREEILARFAFRTYMMDCARRLKSSGYVIGILSDQTNWLDEVEKRYPFFHHFDYVFNSFHLKKSKRDPTVFGDVCTVMGLKSGEVLFVDDNADNIGLAGAEGLKTILFVDARDFRQKTAEFLPDGC